MRSELNNPYHIHLKVSNASEGEEMAEKAGKNTETITGPVLSQCACRVLKWGIHACVI